MEELSWEAGSNQRWESWNDRALVFTLWVLGSHGRFLRRTVTWSEPRRGGGLCVVAPASGSQALGLRVLLGLWSWL